MIEAKHLGMHIYRALKDGESQGFTLHNTPGMVGVTYESVTELLANENGLVAYLFDTPREAESFRSGLESAGEDSSLSIAGYCNLDCWAVLREIDNAAAWEEMSEGTNCPMVVDMRAHMAGALLGPHISHTKLPVAAWDAIHYGGTREVLPDFVMEIDDQRYYGGQAYITLSPVAGHFDDRVQVIAEVNAIPGTNCLTPCLHIHIGDNLAFSVFQVGLQKVMLRPEEGVRIASGAFFPNGEHGYCVEVD